MTAAVCFRDFVPEQRFQPGALALSPDGRWVAYSSNLSGQFNLTVQPIAGGQARQLTHFERQAVRDMAWAPDGHTLVFTADHDGDEEFQLYRIVSAGGIPERLIHTAGGQFQLASRPFDATGRFLVYSVNDRDPAIQDIVIRDLVEGSERRVVPPDEVIFEPVGISPDGRWLLISGVRSNVDVSPFLVDLADDGGAPQEVALADLTGFAEPVGWAADSRDFFVKTNNWGGEFASVASVSVDGGIAELVVSGHSDVEHFVASCGVMLWSVIEGRSTLHARDAHGELDLPPVPNGVLTTMRLSHDGSVAVCQIDAATRPMEIAVLDLGARAFRYLTDTRPTGLRATAAVEPHTVGFLSGCGCGTDSIEYRPYRPDRPFPVLTCLLGGPYDAAGPNYGRLDLFQYAPLPATQRTVGFASRDCRQVSALEYRPAGDGPFPVLIWIHGGPHEQARPNYGRLGLFQYLVSQGVMVLCPDMAGSTGYGTTFQRLIYKDWGGVDLEDFSAAVSYLQGLAYADAERVAVAGGSYGGFAVLSCLSRLKHAWAAGVSICGPSNLVTLSAQCPPTWRTYVDTVLGNPEADAALLRERSPLVHADEITAPLFIIQGANDPRVPRAESDQIVEKLRANGNELRYDVYPDEGHGFTNRGNEIKAYSDVASFLLDHLRGEPAVRDHREVAQVSGSWLGG